MADLVTHVAVVLLPAAIPRWRLAPIAAIGTILPDLLGRAVPLALERLCGLGLPIPASAMWPWAALHEPVGWLLSSTIVACAFVERDRARVWSALCLGGTLHTALDVLQFHHGQGYVLLAPFSSRTYELGWLGSEATVGWAVPLGVATALAWGAPVIWRRTKVTISSRCGPSTPR